MPRQFARGARPDVPASPHYQTIVPQVAGLDGVSQTLSYMRQFADQYKTHPEIRGLAMRLVDALPQKDYDGEIRALWNFVKYRIRYTRDVNGVETIQTPLKTLEFGQGDCDDKCTLLASLLESIGHKTRFRAVGFSRGNVCHVTVEVLTGNGWVTLETTEPVDVGWVPPGIRQNLYENGQDTGAQELAGFLSKVFKFSKNTVKKSLKVNVDNIKHTIKNPLDPIGNIKHDFKSESKLFKETITSDPVLAKAAKIPAIGTILTVVSVIFPGPIGLIAQIAKYALSAYQFAAARQAQIDAARALNKRTLDDGTPIETAQAEVNRLRAQADKQMEYVESQGGVDGLVNAVIASEVIVGGLVVAYLLRRKHVSTGHATGSAGASNIKSITVIRPAK